MRLFIPCSHEVVSGESFVPFDTSQILFRANTGLLGFSGNAVFSLPQQLFEIRNTSTKNILISYYKFELNSGDSRVSPQIATGYRNLTNLNVNSYYNVNNRFGFSGNMTGYQSIAISTSFAVGDTVDAPEYYSSGNYFVLREIAGLVYSSGAYGIEGATNFSDSVAGSTMEFFKISPNLQIPFSGVVVRIND
jgi:hypothetical protein